MRPITKHEAARRLRVLATIMRTHTKDEVVAAWADELDKVASLLDPD